jgi:hypothetical protein
VNRRDAGEFARRWAEAWNKRDVDAVLEHFEQGVVFSSPRALEVTGKPTVHGKASLREYWRASQQRIDSMRFSVERVVWDPESSELSIIYDREVNGRRDRAVEILGFGKSGLVVRGVAYYGVIP